jgi:hypothetical protein
VISAALQFEMRHLVLIFDPETGITVVVIMNQALNAQHVQPAPRLLAIASSP